jgi:catechol 2,3-dioxygenase-like lactoylglutathione lyase family enzyme
MIFHQTCILTGSTKLAAECERFYIDNFGMGIAYASVTENSDYSFYADNLNLAICPFEIIGKSFDEREAKFLRKYGPGLDHICFMVEDLQAVFEKMSVGGVKFHVPPYQYESFMIAWCRDPCGVEVELLQADAEFPQARYESTKPKAHYNHIAIVAGSRELARATEVFYRKHIGLKEVLSDHPSEAMDRTYLKDVSGGPHPWIEIIGTARYNNEHAFLENKGPGLEHHCFVVEDTDNYFRFLKDKGVALASEVVEIGSAKMFYLDDPAGVSVQVLQMPKGIVSRR